MERLQTLLLHFKIRWAKRGEEEREKKNSMITHQNFHHVYPPALKSSPLERAAGAAV